MIDENDLKIGSWYVGFRFASGKQKGVEVRKWRGDGFYSPERGDFLICKREGDLGGFEPSANTTEPAA